MTFGLLLWSQICGLPYDLRHQDSIWVEGIRTWHALARVRSLRDARSGLPVKVKALTEGDKLSLLSLCAYEGRLYWQVLWRGDTLRWVSGRLSPAWLARHLTLLRGTRTWYPGRPPYKVIELILPVALRPPTPGDTLWHLNQTWLDSFVLPWVQTLRLPPGRITGLGLQLRYLRSGKLRYERVSLYVHRHTELPFDEKVYEVTFSRLPRPYHRRLLGLLRGAPAYAYVVRIQDYYPSSLEEARGWMLQLQKREDFPMPAALMPGSAASSILLPE